MVFKNLIKTLLCFALLADAYAQNTILPSTYNQNRGTGWNTSQYEAWTYTRTIGFNVQKLPFRMLKPKNWDPQKKYPMVVMLHGRGEAGTDNNYQLLWGGQIHQDAVNMVNGVTFPGFVLFPQEPDGNWTNGANFSPTQPTTALWMVFDLLDSMKTKFNVDANRIYVHGLSSGGSGAWACLYNRPDLFAAALPMSAPGDTSQARKICSVPIWLSQGGADTNPIPFISRTMMAALRKAGAVDTNITRYSEYPGEGHGVWNLTYYNKDFFPFMLRSSKLNIMLLGSPYLCPAGKVDLSVTSNPVAQFGSDNYQFQWYFGNNSIAGTTSNRISNVSVAGAYYVAFKRNAGSGWINSNVITLTSAPASASPIVTADNSIFLPAPSGSTVALKGPEGQKSYLWSNGSTSKSITVNNSGLYTLKVLPQYGCQSNPSLPVSVRVGPNAANPPLAATGLVAYPISSTSIIVKWQDIATNELGYEIYRSNKRGGPYTFVAAIAQNTNSYIESKLIPYTTYYYKIRSVNNDGGTMSLEETKVTTTRDFIAPTAPSNFKLDWFSTSNIQFIWTASSDSSGIKKYYVYNRDSLVGSSDTTFLNLPYSFLKSNQYYNFVVVSQDKGGNYSSPSNEVAFVNNGMGLLANYYDGVFNVMPNFSTLISKNAALVTNPSVNTQAPIVVNAISGKDVALASTSFAFKFDGYLNIPSPGTYKFFTTSDDGSKLFINNTQVVNNDYDQGMTERSANYTFATKGWYPISVSFRQKQGGYGLITSYQCSGCSPVIPKIAIPTTVLSYFNTGTTAGMLAPPLSNVSLSGSNFYISAPNDKPRIRLFWTGIPTSFPGIVRGFEVYRLAQSGTPTFSSAWSKITTVYSTIGNNMYSYTDTTDIPGKFLKINTKHWYLLKAITSIGNSGYLGYNGTLASPTFVNVVTPNTLTGTLATVSNLSVTGISNSIINLKWSDNSNNESGFEVWRSYNKDGIYAKVLIAPRNTTVFDDSTCEANRKYVYKVRAFNANNFSAFSNIDSTYSLNIPNAPSNLNAYPVGPNAVNLQWVNNSDLAYGYSIFRSTSLTGVYTKIDSIPNPDLTFYQDKSVIDNTKYYYKVRAYIDFPSLFSNIDSANTLLSLIPEADWKLPAVSVTGSMDNSYKNNAINKDKLINALLNKTDFFNFMAINNNKTFTLLIKLPPLTSMPGGALLSFNLQRGNFDASSSADTLEDNQDFNYDMFNDPGRPNNGGANEISFSVSVSGSTLDSTNWINTNYNNAIYSNYLNKIDIPSSLAGRWLKIRILNKNGKIKYLSEIGLYKILPEGKRHNYFLLLGASIEQNARALQGLTRFRKRLLNAGYANGNTALLFNVLSDNPAVAGPGRSSIFLAAGLDAYLDQQHPHAEYIMVHQGGNNINFEGNDMRPLTYDRLLNKYEVKEYIRSFTDIYNIILKKGKIPLISRMHFRDYGKYDNLTTVTSLAVHRGQKQQFGSLPYNLLLDSLCRMYAPFAYNEAERRSSLNYYAISYSDQSLMGGDGIHPINGSVVVNKLVDYWVKYPMALIYNGTQTTPIAQSPGPLSICPNSTSGLNYQNPSCIQKFFDQSNYYKFGTGNTFGPINEDIYPSETYPGAFFPAPTGYGRAYFPKDKLGLMDSVNAAVGVAKRTTLGKDLWNARILVEQISNTSLRIPYVLALDSIRNYNTPENPSGLSVFIVSNSSLNLSWFRNSLNNSGFEVWRSNTSLGNNFKRVGIITSAGTTSFLDNGLSSDTIYYYYVKAKSGGYSSGWSNIVSARPSATYYSKSNGDLSILSTWGIELDGSGNAPSNFTGSGQTFILANRGSATDLVTNLSITGLRSKLIISSGNQLNTRSFADFVGVIDVQSNAILGIYGNVTPNLGLIDSTSTVIFGNSNLIPLNTYGNVVFYGTGLKTLPAGNLYIYRDINIGSGVTLTGLNNTSTLNLLNGSIIFEDATSSLKNISINIAQNTSTFDAKSGSIYLYNLTLSGNSNLNLINSSGLILGVGGGQNLIIKNGSVLDLSDGNLMVNGNVVVNEGMTITGLIKSNGSSIYFNTTNATKKIHNLAFDNIDSKVYNLKINLGTNTDTVNLNSAINIVNTVKLDKGVLNTNSFLTLISNTNNTARIAKVESGARLQGQITAQRMVGPFKSASIYFLGSPILSQTLSTWANYVALDGLAATINGVSTVLGKTNSVFSWNESKRLWFGMNQPSASLVPGVGYRVTLKTSDLSSEYNSGFYANTGIPIIGDASGNPANAFVMPTSKSSSGGGWNLIANPYPSEINWDNESGWDKSGIDNLYYVWDGALRSYKVYIGATNTSGSVSSSGMTPVINSGQGFYVYQPNMGIGSLSINENAKTEVAQLPNFYRAEAAANIFRLFLNNYNGHGDEAIIRLDNNASQDYDQKLDAIKLDGPNVNIATIAPSNVKLTVNTLPNKRIQTIPISVSTADKGKHVFSFENANVLNESRSVYLVDKLKNITIDLKTAVGYDFDIIDDSVTSGDQRFEIKVIDLSISVSEKKGVELYQNIPNPANNYTTIKFFIPQNDIVEFELYNATGQLIKSEIRFFEKGINEIMLNLRDDEKLVNNGIYFYGIYSNGTKITKKMIIAKE